MQHFGQIWSGGTPSLVHGTGVSMMLRESLRAPGVVVWSGPGVVGDQWCQVPWSEWPGFASASIAAKELLPIIVATAIWGLGWKGSVVMCHCDNEAVVASIKGGYCRDPRMAHMLRCLFFFGARFDILLTATHVAGVDNKAADAISRNNVFFNLFPSRAPSRIPPGLVARLVTQENWTCDTWRDWLETLSMLQ